MPGRFRRTYETRSFARSRLDERRRRELRGRTLAERSGLVFEFLEWLGVFVDIHLVRGSCNPGALASSPLLDSSGRVFVRRSFVVPPSRSFVLLRAAPFNPLAGIAPTKQLGGFAPAPVAVQSSRRAFPFARRPGRRPLGLSFRQRRRFRRRTNRGWTFLRGVTLPFPTPVSPLNKPPRTPSRGERRTRSIACSSASRNAKLPSIHLLVNPSRASTSTLSRLRAEGLVVRAGRLSRYARLTSSIWLSSPSK